MITSSLKFAAQLCATLPATLCTTAFAQSPAPPATPAPQLIEKVMVSGEQPGPGMWKVSKGDNVLWIVGTFSPLPQKMTWRAKGIEAVIAKSKEILSQPRASVTAGKLGYFTTLMLLPAAIETKNNPDGATLKDVLPPEIYARWLIARDKYIDGYNTEDNDIERWRPLFAAAELYSSGLKRAGLSSTNVVWPVIRDAAKKYNVKIVDLNYEPTLNDPRGAVRELNKTRLDDVDCLVKTMARIETDIGNMRKGANAWAVGDIDVIRKLPADDQRAACEAIFRNAAFMKKLGQQDAFSQIENMWMAAADKALANNSVTLAVLPMGRLVAADGYIARLKAKGYVVREPDAEE